VIALLKGHLGISLRADQPNGILTRAAAAAPHDDDDEGDST